MTVSEFQKEFGIIGKSKEIRDLIDAIIQIASSDITVLIYGESGVGKEVFARAIHGYSKRSTNQMVSVNCGAIPEGILESELFGHKKGSFTGALENRKGYFEIADGSTLFLDEIAEMPLTTQVKLLRVLETKEFMRIGGETTVKVDVRIIAATNKDLQKEVDARRFREDLYFRLKAVTLTIPPLRKRKEDIPDLVYHFLENFCRNNNIPIPKITDEALELLISYQWPGNIRELKNTIETAVALNRNGSLDISSFQSLIIEAIPEAFLNRNLPVISHKSSEEVDREIIYRALIEIKKDLVELKHLIYKNHLDESGSSNVHITEVQPLETLEREAIKNALIFTNGNKRLAARLLKISERNLYRKIQDYDI